MEFGISEDIVKVKYGKIQLLVKRSELFVFYATFITNEYYRLKIRPRDTVLDFGANIGDFTIKAAKQLNGTGRVIAVEPNHKNVELLKRNIELNHINNVEIYEYAVTDKNGYSYLQGDSVGATVIEDNSKTKVKTITIGDLLSQLNNPTNLVIKMDIEGGEKYAFENTKFINDIREISIELHGKENIRNISMILSKHNFIINEYTIYDEIKNTLKSIILHPLDFIRCERSTGHIAIKGLIGAIRGANPVPAMGGNELMLIYAYRRR
ncbi:MAG: FkbM family methyltransferase [Nitrososphaerota archaeon]|nr:FkbM family methyltransferase [Nitrososphaerota archaeon]